jgi:hypothetical protein
MQQDRIGAKSDSACMLNMRQRPIITPSSSLAGASRVIIHRSALLFTTTFGNKHIGALGTIFAWYRATPSIRSASFDNWLSEPLVRFENHRLSQRR